jgi:DNA (cytosine-5)-methyltransferase 1
MGFPDDYTNIPTATRTTRYQALGNSWAVPVIHWIGKRLFLKETRENFEIKKKHKLNILDTLDDHEYYDLSEAYSYLVSDNLYLNASVIPNDYVFGNMKDIVDCNPPKEIYISPVGSHGIIRRKDERNLSMNERLEMILRRTAEKMPIEKINKISRVQKRGRFSEGKKESQEKEDTQFVQITQMTFDDLF